MSTSNLYSTAPDLKIDHRGVQNEAEVPAPAWTFSCVPLPVVFVFVLHAAFLEYHQLELLLVVGYFHFPNPRIKIYIHNISGK